jgi:cysteinyl-tRNA synthetase
LLKDWPGCVLRHHMLQTHYHQPLNWTNSSLISCFAELKRWAIELRDGLDSRQPGSPSNDVVAALNDDLNVPAALAVLRQKFASKESKTEKGREALQSDLEFFGILDRRSILLLSSATRSSIPLTDSIFDRISHFQTKLLNSPAALDFGEYKDDEIVIRFTDGFFDVTPVIGTSENLNTKVNGLLAARNAARKAKDFKEADRIRDELAKMGVVLKDTKDGTTWEIAR